MSKPYEIGCMVHIQHVERLDDDCMNIIAVGHERFKTHVLSYDKTLPGWRS